MVSCDLTAEATNGSIRAKVHLTSRAAWQTTAAARFLHWPRAGLPAAAHAPAYDGDMSATNLFSAAGSGSLSRRVSWAGRGRWLLSAVALWSLTLGAGCGTRGDGDLGVATFTAKSCGGPYNDLEGCDLKKVLATGAKVDVRAGVKADNSPLKLRSDLPGVVEVVDLGGTNYTLVGKNPGRAVITAFDGSGDRDRISITVDDMAMISYLEVSSGAGDFKLQPVGDVDGTFALRQTVQNFTLLFAPIDAANNKMLGRESFTTELQPGLYFQPGKENPTAMQMDLMRPTQAGTYSLLLRAKVGPGRFKLLISTP